jgi:hypothetical protein
MVAVVILQFVISSTKFSKCPFNSYEDLRLGLMDGNDFPIAF